MTAPDPALQGPVRILGGPGSGKTELIARLHRGLVASGTAPDRNTYIVDPSCGSTCVYLLSPYWTNQTGTLEALNGPPLGTQASVTTFAGSTRQSWDTRSS